MVGVEKFMSRYARMRDPTVFHKMLAQTLKALELLGSGSPEFEIADQADADTRLVQRQLLHMTAVQLPFPATPDVNLSVRCLARTV